MAASCGGSYTKTQIAITASEYTHTHTHIYIYVSYSSVYVKIKYGPVSLAKHVLESLICGLQTKRMQARLSPRMAHTAIGDYWFLTV